MKRIFTVLALLAVMTSAVNAQVKSVSAAQNAVENAKKDVENPKKNTKFATWIKYGKALVDAYDAPAGNGWINASRQELQLVSGNEKPVSVEKVTLGGQEWDKEVYPTRNYYFNAAGQLGLIEITKPVYENALDMALEAYGKANELDVKHAKTKDITGAILSIAGKYIDEAYTAYTLGDLAKASDYFEKAARANAAEPVCQVDSNSIYNAGFTAWLAGNNDRAKEFFEKSVEIGYYGEDGETYAKLADIAEKAGDAEKSKDYLEECARASWLALSTTTLATMAAPTVCSSCSARPRRTSPTMLLSTMSRVTSATSWARSKTQWQLMTSAPRSILTTLTDLSARARCSTTRPSSIPRRQATRWMTPSTWLW